MPRREPRWLLPLSFLLAVVLILGAWLATPRSWVEAWLRPLRPPHALRQAPPSPPLLVLPPAAVEAAPPPPAERRERPRPPTPPLPMTLPLSGEWWRAALRIDETARASILAAPAPAAAAKDSLRSLARRLLAAVPDSVRRSFAADTSASARLDLLTRTFTEHLNRELPAWQAAAQARRVADIISRESYLFGEYWLER